MRLVPGDHPVLRAIAAVKDTPVLAKFDEDDERLFPGAANLADALKLCVLQLAENACHNYNSAFEWLTFLDEFHGGGFHPDNRFEEYADDNNQPTYTSEESAMLQECFSIVADEIDVYAVLLPLMEKRMQARGDNR